MDNQIDAVEEVKSYRRLRDDDMRRAGHIIEKLNQLTGILFRRGYGITQLIFSDHSFVSVTTADLEGVVVASIRAGHRPLGCVACACDRGGDPATVRWHKGDEDARDALGELAQYLFQRNFS